ncbi:hypothetical protein AMATHDRAFT_77862 [Amanita thiersii Skay4041]|uniref:Methyltransferase type 12 domain-containing protein n=1 Tax=Amanita thiersii Skay4041 TaxID=703135 RepID=A0A2A9NCJ6_9AGAR|nr:hypothetical protein AMATHDRAFT_77862 [Amanita thiersii Skay4041]
MEVGQSPSKSGQRGQSTQQDTKSDVHNEHLNHDVTGQDGFLLANQEYFDRTAHEYDDLPRAAERAQKTVDAMRNMYQFKDDTIALDYACGTGLISRQIFRHIKKVLGVDISQQMVDQYNSIAFQLGLSAERMEAVCVELKGDEGELGGVKFDVVFCAWAYHHINEVGRTTQILGRLLKPGGVLLVVDLENTDPGIFVEHGHIVPHTHGFNASAIEKVFKEAGLEKFAYREAFVDEMEGREIKLFIAKGVKLI